MNDVLSYSETELEQLSITELELLLKQAKYNESLFNTRQLVEKTMMNSLYGALANKHFPLFNAEMAAAITGAGRYFIQTTAANIEKCLQKLIPSDESYVIYSDTDSVYFQIKAFVDKYKETNPEATIADCVEWCDRFEKKVIKNVITETIESGAKRLNSYDKSVIASDREAIADCAVFTAKKKYYARVRDMEGTRYPIDNPYIKIMGLEIIQGGTPPFAKKYLKEAIPQIFDKSEADLRIWLKAVKEKYINEDLNKIAPIKGVTNIDYTLGDKGIPIGARSALAYNKYIDENGLEQNYEKISAGDKTKRFYLTTPNKFNSNVIAYTSDSFIKEIDCIDYDKNFDKTFMSSLNLMVSTLNYDLEKETQELDDW